MVPIELIGGVTFPRIGELPYLLTLGGYGYAKEFHVERFLREVLIARIAPVSEQLILCYVAERVLGLPKSY